ncbi:MAG: indole-3-glycerol phosphate synthase TrpC [Anaerolineales bacterium]|nr:indole-3-glycerol phosphate synthase TrpC [Anaerolineales bacterium]
MNILEKIISHKRDEIAALDASALRRAAEQSPTPRDFLSAICPPLPAGDGRGVRERRRFAPRPSLIAELKRASPSKGILAPHLDLFQVADIYTQNGAAAISVLTDEKFFMGSLETLRQLRNTQHATLTNYQSPITNHQHLHRTQVQVLPFLRKDFTIAEVQLYEARANGADAILLIAAALTDDKHFADLHACALSLGLTALVEVHDEAETERALKLKDVKLIGINNRNLATFEVSLETTERIRPMISPDIAVVAESGIFTASDVDRLAKINIDAILVGEALVTADDIPAKVRELSGA